MLTEAAVRLVAMVLHQVLERLAQAENLERVMAEVLAEGKQVGLLAWLVQLEAQAVLHQGVEEQAAQATTEMEEQGAQEQEAKSGFGRIR